MVVAAVAQAVSLIAAVAVNQVQRKEQDWDFALEHQHQRIQRPEPPQMVWGCELAQEAWQLSGPSVTQMSSALTNSCVHPGKLDHIARRLARQAWARLPALVLA